jgi:tetratricopeptide (TPR) repeat protein
MGTLKLLKKEPMNAANYLSKSIQINPSQPIALIRRGISLGLAGNPKAALTDFERALKLEPKSIEALYNKAKIESDMRRYDDSARSYTECLRIKNSMEESYIGRGRARIRLNDIHGALDDFNKAITLNPCNSDAYIGRAASHHELGMFDAALLDFDKSIEFGHSSHEANFGKALTLLTVGNSPEGWALYENRLSTRFKNAYESIQGIRWNCTDNINGKTIYIYAEQGLGDTLQFCRYIDALKKMGANIILEAPEPLLPLLASLDQDMRLVSPGCESLSYDYHCPLMSLPLAFQRLAIEMPTKIPYLFNSDDVITFWHGLLGEKRRARIGLAWSGNPENELDRKRSIDLEHFCRIINLPHDFYALQKIISERDIQFINSHDNFHIYSHLLHDFSYTAGLVHHMDLVISVDTSIAHLAGSLGHPLWILLPHVPDFRWLTNRPDSPWYPSAKLFRQAKRGKWQEVFELVLNDLSKFNL